MKNLAPRFVSALVVLLGLACVPACTNTGEEICDRFKALCPSTSTTTDAGTATTTVKCDAEAADDLSNKDEVKDCLNAASNCDGAVACLLKAKK